VLKTEICVTRPQCVNIPLSSDYCKKTFSAQLFLLTSYLNCRMLCAGVKALTRI